MPLEAAGPASPTLWRFGDRHLLLDRPRIVAILNVTPDSFSDGGDLAGPAAAVDRADALLREGADVLDVGGESTRPGAATVPADEEVQRVVPVVEALVSRFPAPVSVDTRKAAVARAALDAGASIVNDVSGLAFDPEMAGVVAAADAGIVLMHMRGGPADMQSRADYHDVVSEVRAELSDALARAGSAGVEPDRVVLDPGLGFAKTAGHNLLLLRRLDTLLDLGRPLLVGPSRKSFLGGLLGVPPRERVHGTAAACVLAYLGGARLLRVHDVGPVAHALSVARAVVDARAETLSTEV